MIDVKKLIDKAIEGRSNSYSPYSHFKVGASLLLKDGSYITGCNVENVSYGLSNCAERTALFKMISMGKNKNDVLAMAIVADTTGPVSPCGACRQVMKELLNADTPVYLANLKYDYKEYSVTELLPYSFEEIENAES